MGQNRRNCRFKFPHPVYKKTRLHSNRNIIQKKGRIYETKRDADSAFINAYNPTILRHFRSNMDIQCVNNAERVAYYICAYICKNEQDELRNALSNLLFNVFKKEQSMTPFQKLWRTGQTVLKHGLSVQEAAFRMSNLHMVEQSRQTVYLNVHMPLKRYRMLKSKKELESMDDESTDIFKSNIIDYYRSRLVHLEGTSLYYFAVWYEKCTPPKSKSQQNKGTNNHFIHIENFDVWFSRRNKADVVRFPRFVVHSPDYYYSFIILLLPHRDESELLSGYESAQEAFEEKHDYFDTSIDFTFFSFATDIESAIHKINSIREEESAQARDDMNNVDVLDTGVGADANCNDDDATDCSDTLPGSTTDGGYDHDSTGLTETNSGNLKSMDYQLSACEEDASDNYIVHGVMSEMTMQEIMMSIDRLTVCQRHVFNHIVHHYENMGSSMHLFISGGGGVGKSYLVELLICWINLKCSVIPGTQPVVVCAPTGTAARHVGGRTIHSLL